MIRQKEGTRETPVGLDFVSFTYDKLASPLQQIPFALRETNMQPDIVLRLYEFL